MVVRNTESIRISVTSAPKQKLRTVPRATSKAGLISAFEDSADLRLCRSRMTDLFFTDLVELLRELERRRFDGLDNCTRNFCEYVVTQASHYATYVYRLIGIVEAAADSRPVRRLKCQLEQLLLKLRELQGEWEHELARRQLPVTSRDPERHGGVILGTIPHGAGRPFVDISVEQLYYLHSLGFTWTEVAAVLGMYINRACVHIKA